MMQSDIAMVNFDNGAGYLKRKGFLLLKRVILLEMEFIIVSIE